MVSRYRDISFFIKAISLHKCKSVSKFILIILWHCYRLCTEVMCVTKQVGNYFPVIKHGLFENHNFKKNIVLTFSCRRFLIKEGLTHYRLSLPSTHNVLQICPQRVHQLMYSCRNGVPRWTCRQPNLLLLKSGECVSQWSFHD